MSERDVLTALSAATVGSRELDEMIARAAGWYLVHAAESYSQAAGDQEFDQWHEPDNTPASFLPEFSDSIDAALTLVPEGWRIHNLDQYVLDLSGQGHDRWRVWLSHITCDGRFLTEFSGAAWKPAIAIVLAALRARQSHPAASEGEG